MKRRTFMQGAAGLFCAPAIVKAENIMKLWTPRDPDQLVWMASDWGVADFTYAIFYVDAKVIASTRVGPNGAGVFDLNKEQTKAMAVYRKVAANQGRARQPSAAVCRFGA